MIEPKETFHPRPEQAAFYEAHKPLFTHLYESNRDSMHTLARDYQHE